MATASASDPIATVGFIGLGDMGGGMATRIVDAGWPTMLWARRPDALEPFAAERADTLAELGARCDLVGVCVWADDDVREVVSGVLEGCRPGTVVAVHSTVRPATVRELAEQAAARGVAVLDAPVSGGRAVALEGTLTVAVGGDEGDLDRCRPVFDAFAGTVVHLGGVGAGQVAKLVNNAVLAANLAVADDALALGEALGVDAGSLAEFLRAGSGRSFGLEVARSEGRRAALPALAKDLQRLEVEADGGGPLVREVAAEAIRRLENEEDQP